jgi:hypothetical protein
MPGPFFSEASVKQSHHMLVAWKEGDQWTTPSNHALELFNHYQSTFNPVYLNESRLERTLYENSVRKSARKKNQTITLDPGLMRYLTEKIIPTASDSASVIIIRETAGKRDSVLFNQKLRLSHD